MSSGISGSYASAEVAAATLREEFPERKIRLVDTLSASLGEGLQVLKAVEDRDVGVDIDSAADRLLEQPQKVLIPTNRPDYAAFLADLRHYAPPTLDFSKEADDIAPSCDHNGHHFE